MTSGSTTTATVEALFIYPLKSARAIPRERTVLGPAGFEWDRHWMVVNAQGRFLTQRTHPRLAVIETMLTDDALVLRAPGLSPLTVPCRPEGTPREVRIWDDTCTALDQGDEAAAWLGSVIGEPVRLVRVPATPGRRANPRYAGDVAAPVAFPDGFPLLVCNTASLEELNRRLPQPLPMTRFRPNIVLGGLQPFAEDRISEIRIGEAVLRLVKPCTRCAITGTDQVTGERSGDPLPVLRTFRFDRALRGVTFGENAVIAAGVGATIERGTSCTVVFEQAPAPA
ncbi:MAG: MOSC N-terminal beta barrel domain-containing protein [Pseudomonadota bacterium]|mgnify:CR=1 FL=1|jgi:uncharacterized protein YcbX